MDVMRPETISFWSLDLRVRDPHPDRGDIRVDNGNVNEYIRLEHHRWEWQAPQLYDLEADPEELRDVAGDPANAAVLEACRKRLYEFCDPEEVDRRAKRRQAELLARCGGREAALARGDLGFTPAPGTRAEID